MMSAEIFIKVEGLQHAGSFKFRGASNAVMELQARGCSGVCTVSSGNHAQALARAARDAGIPAAILMPEDSPEFKRQATAAYGAKIVLYDRYSMPQDEAGQRFASEIGYTFVSPYDDPRVIAGAGTVAFELLEEVSDIDVVVVPVGGGGLMSGTALAAQALVPGARVVGVESSASGVWSRSLALGRRVQLPAVPRTIADGQQLIAPGALTFGIVSRLNGRVTQVDDAEILTAMRFLHEGCHIVAEPSGACGLAAILSGAVPVLGKRVGVVVSGANLGLERLFSLMSPQLR
jgi:threonine dehydratase